MGRFQIEQRRIAERLGDFAANAIQLSIAMIACGLGVCGISKEAGTAGRAIVTPEDVLACWEFLLHTADHELAIPIGNAAKSI